MRSHEPASCFVASSSRRRVAGLQLQRRAVSTLAHSTQWQRLLQLLHTIASHADCLFSALTDGWIEWSSYTTAVALLQLQQHVYMYPTQTSDSHCQVEPTHSLTTHSVLSCNCKPATATAAAAADAHISGHKLLVRLVTYLNSIGPHTNIQDTQRQVHVQSVVVLHAV